MALSLFLAKLIGLYLLIFALIAVVRKEQFLSVAKGFISSESLFAFSGMISLGLGLAILIGHHVWEINWRGLITLLGLLLILQGVLRMGFTSHIQKMISGKKINDMYVFILIFMIVIGCYLTYAGFNY